ncbi:hypothetical protein LZ30DRAFT_277276 [Colletotrichum cereale]|nr:hypothetical protein LZ30DRAFT_277276 [Colletotrichum cereale]
MKLLEQPGPYRQVCRRAFSKRLFEPLPTNPFGRDTRLQQTQTVSTWKPNLLHARAKQQAHRTTAPASRSSRLLVLPTDLGPRNLARARPGSPLTPCLHWKAVPRRSLSQHHITYATIEEGTSKWLEIFVSFLALQAALKKLLPRVCSPKFHLCHQNVPDIVHAMRGSWGCAV